jgi:acetyl esterase/lipase
MFGRIVLLVLLLLIAVAVFLPAGRAALGAIALLPEFFPNLPLRPLEVFTPAPTRSTIQLEYGGRTSVADLYDPGTPGKHGGVIIFLGVAPAGRDDPRVVRLGEGLARIGLTTFIPQSQDLVDSKVDPGEIDELVAAFQYLAARPDVDPNRIAIGGFCIGAGLALDAAEDPRINQQVALVNSFTAYDDLSAYIVSILTHTIQPFPPQSGVDRVPWEPAQNATNVLDDHLISLDSSAAEQDLLRKAVHDPGAPRPDPAKLSPIGRTIWAMINARDPATAEQLLKELPPEAQSTLRRLSPDGRLDQLHAQVFIMHDHDDTNVPYVQSRLLASQLRPGQAEYDEFQIFNHVDPTAAVSPLVFVADTARLGAHMFQIVEILQGVTPVQHF